MVRSERVRRGASPDGVVMADGALQKRNQHPFPQPSFARSGGICARHDEVKYSHTRATKRKLSGEGKQYPNPFHDWTFLLRPVYQLRSRAGICFAWCSSARMPQLRPCGRACALGELCPECVSHPCPFRGRGHTSGRGFPLVSYMRLRISAFLAANSSSVRMPASRSSPSCLS